MIMNETLNEIMYANLNEKTNEWTSGMVTRMKESMNEGGQKYMNEEPDKIHTQNRRPSNL